MRINVLLTPMFLSDGFTAKLIDDSTQIQIREVYGRTLAVGHWYNDDILNIVTSGKYIVRYWVQETARDGKKYFLIEVDRNN